MDWPEMKEKAGDLLKRYRFVALILIVGLLLMAIPERETEEQVPSMVTSSGEQSFSEELARILSTIKGAGKVEVLLTECSGSETIYQTDTVLSDTDQKEDTVILSDSGRAETGLVRQVNPPEYLGALVVCQGGDSPTVRLAIVEAVMSVTGLKANQITVLKMK